MKVFSVLWTVCLVGLCHGGDDGDKEQETSLASKVDGSLFNVEESLEDHVKVLKLTTKADTKVTELRYDRQQIWSGSTKILKSPNLVEALIYFDENAPVLVAIRAVKGGNESTVYRYHDGKQWQNGREGTHKTRLKELQDAARPKQPPKVSKPLDPPGPLVLDLSVESADDDGKVTLYKNDNGELKYRAFTSESGNYFEKILHYGVVIWEAESGQRGTFASFHSKEDAMLIRMYVQTGGHVERKYFEKNASGGWTSMTEEVYDQKLKDLKNGVTNQSSLQGSATLRTDNPTVVPSSDEFSEAQMVKQGGVTLDLTDPDASNIEVSENNDDGIKTKRFTPKDAFHISSVMDGGVTLWMAGTGEISGFVTSCTRGDSSLITIGISKGSDSKLDFKYFEKNADGWKDLTRDDFFNKLDKMRKSVSPSSNPSSTLPPQASQ